MIWNPRSNQANWELRHVVHLHRRAAWGATWPELSRDLDAGFESTISRLTNPEATELHPRTSELALAAVARNSVSLLKAAWVNEMWHGANPLGEQLTLMWANHFATGFQKVLDCQAMFDQYLTLRRHASGSFGELIRAMVRDRALLIWLDGDSNRRGHSNENLARELLELFTLGEGHYSESDVRETARALTGWRIRMGEVSFDENRHDDGEKWILGQTSPFDADSVVDLLVKHPATPRRIAWRICDHLFGRGRISDDAIEALADYLRKNGLNIGKAVEAVLRSDSFFDNRQIASRFCPPASFVVGNLRALELHDPEQGAAVVPEVAAAWMRTLGQDLFQPPSVGGWTGGSTWISAGSMINRARFALRVADGTLHAQASARAPDALARRHGEEPSSFANRLLFGSSEKADASLPQLLTSYRAQFD